MAYIGKQPAKGNFVKLDTITATATTTFNLLNGGVAYFPQSANNCLVSLNGILQAPTDSYTISGSTIIFSSALTISDVIDFIIVLGDVLNIGTPSDNTVSLAKLTATGTKDATTFLRGDNTFAVPAGSKFGTALLHVRDEKASGTNGGATTGGSWVKRDLNTTLTNEISGASISSSVITLPSGTYFIYAHAPTFTGGNHKIKLRNTTDSSDTLIGSTDYINNSVSSVTRSFLAGRFTISAQKNFELQHRTSVTVTNNGFGESASMSVVEVYADVQIWKVS
jgi:hypothetical protein